MLLLKFRRGELVDFIFPRLEGEYLRKSERASRLSDHNEEAKFRVEKLPSDETRLKEYLESVDKLIDKEQSRRTSVDARLMSIVGLTSIAATVVLTALFAMAAGTMPLPQGAAKWILVIGCFYLALQLYAALLAAVNGLSRASYVSETALDFLPEYKVSPSFLLRDRICNKLYLLDQHQWVNNGKVSLMAVAHRAMKNFLAMLVMLAFAASVMALNRESPKESASCSDVLSKLLIASANCTTTQGSILPAGMQVPISDENDLSVRDLLLPWTLLSIGMVTTVSGLFLLLAPPPFRQRSIGVALSTGGLLLCVLAGSKFEFVALKFDRFIEKLELRLSVGHATSPRKITLAKIMTIGPFPDGSHVLDRTTLLPCVQNALSPYINQQVVAWQVVGRVDKRRLRPDHAAVYGSNQGLAMARAAWVNDVVLAGLTPFDTSAAVISVGGARNIGTVVRPEALQMDRAVDVYALLDNKVHHTAFAQFEAERRAIACPN